ncbi:hypothetical protein AB4516_10820 [Vibrio sp. 10N.222.54.F12]|uniref:hypothetical protein n=1 Tax=Vibrio TaxID=662 RepID=UPI000C83C95E|nr:hypothetical protein [Vibrio tasmaniensis]PML19371.1 hypothetical protein BCT83_00210 [Vibrio tasmaniensis]PML46682.1 hypothetical protein BCT76_13985 [Vibrio tasmaniensis]
MVQESKTQHELRFGHSTKAKSFQSFSQKIEKNWYMLLTVLGTASFTYAGGFASGAPNFITKEVGKEWAWADTVQAEGMMSMMEVIWVFICHPYMHFFYAIVLLALGLSGTSKDYENLSNRNDELESKLTHQKNVREIVTSNQEEIAKLNGQLREKHQELVTIWLKGTFSYLMNDDKAVVKENTHARISIYYVYNNHFYLLARYSPNAEYDQTHRQKFPMGRGIIYEAYQHLEVHEDSLAEYNEATPDSFYNSIEDKYFFKREQLKNFNMKSCRYFGRAIREADATQGVILIESTKSCDLSEEQVQKTREHFEKNWSHLSQFVRHGIAHDINSNYHKTMSTDLDFLDKLDQRPSPSPSPEAEMLATLSSSSEV